MNSSVFEGLAHITHKPIRRPCACARDCSDEELVGGRRLTGLTGLKGGRANGGREDAQMATAREVARQELAEFAQPKSGKKKRCATLPAKNRRSTGSGCRN